MTKTAKRTRSVICTIVSFVMSLSITLTVLCATLSLTALNPTFAVRTAMHSEYSEHLSAELKEEFVSFGNACNVDAAFFDSIFTDVITTDSIDRDTEAVLREFYAGQVQAKRDTAALEDALFTRLQAYAVEKGFTLSDEVNENLRGIASELCDVYNAYVSVFSMSVFKTASRLLAKYRPFGWYAAAAGAVLFAVSAVILRLYFQKKKNYLRYFIYAFSATALMLLTAPLIALIADIGGGINISNASLYDFATGMMNGVLGSIAASAAVPALLTVLLSLVRHNAVKNNR